MKIMLVTDAWEPQVNGVVRTLKSTSRELAALGHRVEMLTPLEFRRCPARPIPEIRLSILPSGKLRGIDAFAPDALHIATEGPLGLPRAARARKLPFTTAYHTRFPEYVQARFGIPLAWTYRFLRWFHAPSRAVMAPTPVVLKDLENYGFTNVVLWTRGVDLDIFTADGRTCSTRRGRSSCTSGAWRSRRTSRHSCNSICRARSGSWRRPRAGRPEIALPGSELLGVLKQPSWRRCMLRPMCSCFRAAPTRSASCSRWQAGCRWPRTLSPGRSTCSAAARPARCTKTCRKPASSAEDRTRHRARPRRALLVARRPSSSRRPAAAAEDCVLARRRCCHLKRDLNDHTSPTAATAPTHRPFDEEEPHADTDAHASEPLGPDDGLAPLPPNPYKRHRGITRAVRAASFAERAARRDPRGKRVPAGATLAAVMLPAGAFAPVPAASRALLIASVLLVLIVELLNSSVEAAIDRISLERHELSKRAKDFGSAAVTIALFACVTTWGFVLGPVVAGWLGF
jgi:diacylglycerol kinase (ATP)